MARADDIVTKPELRITVGKPRREPRRPEGFIGEDPTLRAVFDILERVADTDCTVLITGESGTGKELVARGLHEASGRRARPFVAINCGAIPKDLVESELFGHVRGAFTGATQARVGKFEFADGGTLLLDEVGELDAAVQVKLLRVLQEKEFTPVGETQPRKSNVRIVAATNRDLEMMVARGEFRADLFFRLNVIPVHMPPLRERRADILPLCEHFITIFNRRRGRSVAGLDEAATAVVRSWPWPGNVRELENTIERIVLLKGEGTITLEDLPRKMRETEAGPMVSGVTLPSGGCDINDAVEQFENRLILLALERTGGNRKAAAELLCLNRTTLVERMRKKNLLKVA